MFTYHLHKQRHHLFHTCLSSITQVCGGWRSSCGTTYKIMDHPAYHTALTLVNPDDIAERENIIYEHMRKKKQVLVHCNGQNLYFLFQQSRMVIFISTHCPLVPVNTYEGTIKWLKIISLTVFQSNTMGDSFIIKHSLS